MHNFTSAFFCLKRFVLVPSPLCRWTKLQLKHTETETEHHPICLCILCNQQTNSSFYIYMLHMESVLESDSGQDDQPHQQILQFKENHRCCCTHSMLTHIQTQLNSNVMLCAEPSSSLDYPKQLLQQMKLCRSLQTPTTFEY